jgi:hypothetical protein
MGDELGWIRRRHSDGSHAASSVPAGKPLARSEDLVIEELGDELLVYDLTTNQAHALGATAARVWRACDGKTDAVAFSVELGLDRETVTRALDELRANGLLDEGAEGAPGITRRDLSVKATKVGGAVAAAPLIVSLAAPLPAAAQTVTPETCTEGGVSHGCGIDCMKRHCCCCCQGTDPNLRPTVCEGDEMCCLPSAQCCAGVFGPAGPGGANCSDTNKDAGCPSITC